MRRRILMLGLAAGVGLTAEAPKVVLVAGRPSHDPGEHEFNAGMLLLAKWLRQNGVEPVVVKGGWPEDEGVLRGARSLVFYADGRTRHPVLEGERWKIVAEHLKKGAGFACLHFAVDVPAERGGPEFLEWLGGYYEFRYSKNPVSDVEVTPATPGHPISRGWGAFRARDEWYHRIRFREGDRRVTPILTAMLPMEAPNREVIAWATERADGGRGFGFTGAHFHHNWGIPEFRRLVVNAILWTAKVEPPPGGAKCDVSAEELAQNLDDKPVRKRP